MNAKLIPGLLLAVGLAGLVGCTSNTSAADTAVAPAPRAAVVSAEAPVAPAAPMDTAELAPAPAPVTLTPEVKVPDAPLLMSSNVADVAQLARAGVSERLIQNFIQNTRTPFRLTAKDIIYLNDLGVADSIVDAMMNHDRQLGVEVVAKPEVAPVVEPAAPAAPETVIVVQQPAPVTVEYFYDSLTPYGTWVEVDGYGRCWQPAVVVSQSGWRPYCDRGHWVYTSCGWYWESDYSWGVTFHYGRWFRDSRRGWCWAPDTAWGPAWVSWRESSSYCGWAPLPPRACYRPGYGYYYRDESVSVSFSFGLGADCYTFVPRNHFGGGRPQHHAVPASQNTQIINNTTVVNNYVTGNNNTVINQGIGNPNQGGASAADRAQGPHFANPRGHVATPLKSVGAPAVASSSALAPAAASGSASIKPASPDNSVPVANSSSLIPSGKNNPRLGGNNWNPVRSTIPNRNTSVAAPAAAAPQPVSVEPAAPAAPMPTRATPAVTRSLPYGGIRAQAPAAQVAPSVSAAPSAPVAAPVAETPRPATPGWNNYGGGQNAGNAIRDRIIADRQQRDRAPSFQTPQRDYTPAAPSQPVVRPSAPAPSYAPSYTPPVRQADPAPSFQQATPARSSQPSQFTPPSQFGQRNNDEARRAVVDALTRGSNGGRR